MKTCKRCQRLLHSDSFYRHKTMPDGLQPWCKACKKTYARIYVKTPRGRAVMLAAQRRFSRSTKGQAHQYRHNRTEKARERQKRYRATEKCAIRLRRYYLTQKSKARYERWRRSEKCKAARHRYRQTPKGRYQKVSNEHKRRVLKGRSATLTMAEWQHILDLYKHCCAYCGRSDAILTQDHYVPLCKGGHHSAENVVPACKSCNSRKRDRLPSRLFL
jgi:hypothetical protein